MPKADEPTARALVRAADGEGAPDAPSADGVHIVSSDHLASPEAWQMSELEYAMTMSYNAFTRWMTRCMAAAGQRDLNPLDILVIHNVNHREREKRLSDIVFTLNVDDSHTVNYALKKLVKAGLVSTNKVGKEIFYRTTAEGAELCRAYRDVRQSCLIDAALATHPDFGEMSRSAQLLRGVSGLYDQASRAASSL